MMSNSPEIYTLRATIVSLSCNIVLVCIKSAALVAVNSLAIAIDLGISIVGLAVSVILFYSLKLANRPADDLHNYGYGKVEHVCEAMEAVVLIGIALAMSSQSIARIMHPKHVSLPLVGCVASGINAVINFSGGSYIFKMSRKSGSPAIHAEGVHYFLEGLISSIVGASFLVSMFFMAEGMENVAVHIDPLAALIVSCLIIIPSIKLARNAFYNLLDASVEEEGQLEILKQIGMDLADFCEFKDLKTRTAGRNKFIELTLVIPQNLSLRKGHEIARRVETRIGGGVPYSYVSVKLEPCAMDCSYASEDPSKCPYLVQ